MGGRRSKRPSSSSLPPPTHPHQLPHEYARERSPDRVPRFVPSAGESRGSAPPRLFVFRTAAPTRESRDVCDSLCVLPESEYNGAESAVSHCSVDTVRSAESAPVCVVASVGNPRCWKNLLIEK